MKDAELKVNGRRIRVDADGRISLNDIHRAAGYSTNKTPADWRALPTTNPFIIAAMEKITGKSGELSKKEISSVYYARGGTGNERERSK